MATVVFVGEGGELAVEVRGRERLVDVCDAAGAPVPFSCRGATCGTCRVELLEGAALLEPPATAEVEARAALRLAPDERLVCQATVRDAPGLVRLRIAARAPPTLG